MIELTFTLTFPFIKAIQLRKKVIFFSLYLKNENPYPAWLFDRVFAENIGLFRHQLSDAFDLFIGNPI